MMKGPQDTQGFSVVEVLMVLVIIGIIGFSGWFVWQSKAKTEKNLDAAAKSSTPTATIANKTKKQSDPIYTSADYGYSFEYPLGWETAKGVDGFGDNSGWSPIIKSPDLATSNESMGFHLTEGAMLYVSASSTTAATADQYFQEDDFLSRVVKNKEATTLAGVDAVRYTLGYESSPNIDTMIVKNGTLYQVNMTYADQTALNTYQARYDALVSSFKLN